MHFEILCSNILSLLYLFKSNCLYGYSSFHYMIEIHHDGIYLSLTHAESCGKCITYLGIFSFVMFHWANPHSRVLKLRLLVRGLDITWHWDPLREKLIWWVLQKRKRKKGEHNYELGEGESSWWWTITLMFEKISLSSD